MGAKLERDRATTSIATRTWNPSLRKGADVGVRAGGDRITTYGIDTTPERGVAWRSRWYGMYEKLTYYF